VQSDAAKFTTKAFLSCRIHLKGNGVGSAGFGSGSSLSLQKNGRKLAKEGNRGVRVVGQNGKGMTRQEGVMKKRSEGKTVVTPSGPKTGNPWTAGTGPTGVDSNTPENQGGHLNPSAPEDANTTPGTTGEK
jgi:hypothetical protein